MDYEKSDLWLGAFILAALAVVIFVFVAINRKRLGSDSRHVVIHLPNIAGIDKGVEVFYRGYRVGAVDNVSIVYQPEFHFVVRLAVKPEIKVHPGTTVSVRNLGFGGSKFLELLPPPKYDWKVTVPEGELLAVVPDIDVMTRANEVMGQVQKIVHDFQEKGTVNDVQETVKHARSALTNLDKALANLNAIMIEDRASLKTSVDGTSKIMAHVSDLLEKKDAALKQSLDSMNDAMRHVPAILINLEELTAEVKRRPWRLIRKSDEEPRPLDHNHPIPPPTPIPPAPAPAAPPEAKP